METIDHIYIAAGQAVVMLVHLAYLRGYLNKLNRWTVTSILQLAKATGVTLATPPPYSVSVDEITSPGRSR